MEWEYKGHVIKIMESGVFASDSHTGDTLSSVKTRIDKQLADEAVEARADISLPMLSEDGTPITVTGLRRNNGDLLQVPKARGYNRGPLPKYADSLGVRRVIQQIKVLEGQVAKLRDVLKPATLSQGYMSGGEYRPKDDADYPNKLQLLKQNYERAKKAADSIPETGVGPEKSGASI